MLLTPAECYVRRMEEFPLSAPEERNVCILEERQEWSRCNIPITQRLEPRESAKSEASQYRLSRKQWNPHFRR